MNGPALHFAYTRVIPLLGKEVNTYNLFKKLFFTQVVYSIVSISAFYAFLAKLEGKSYNETKEEVWEKLWPTYKTNLQVWPFL